MSKLLFITGCFVFFVWLMSESSLSKLDRMNSELNYVTHSKLSYKPKGYINVLTMIGGFNNQLEQLWFLNILAQRTNRGLVEKPMKLITKVFGPVRNISEIINRDKYLSVLPTIQEREYFKHCRHNIKRIDLPELNWFENDELERMINEINNTPDDACITLGFFPSYALFGRDKFVDWVPTFKELILPNFEFSSHIKLQADQFVKENGLKDGNFVSVQFRRGDFERHCGALFTYPTPDWSFAKLVGDKYAYDTGDFDEHWKHCYPTVDELADIIHNLSTSLSKPFTKVLIMTNAKKDEIEELKQALSSKNLEYLRFSPDLNIVPKSIGWTITHSLAVEMELGIRGNYLIGNRHSSITSNIMGLRLNKDLNNTVLI